MTNIPSATAESFWAALQDLTERQAETNRILTEKQAETGRQIAETNRILTEKFAETDRILTEKQAETGRQIAETNRILTEKFAETDRILTEKQAETDRQIAETDRQISRLEKQIGGVSNNHGLFAEEYYINSLEECENTLLAAMRRKRSEIVNHLEKNVLITSEK